MKLLPAVLVVAAATLAPSCSSDTGPEPSTGGDADLAEVWRLASAGIGHTERFEFKRAAEAWTKALELRPGWVTARVNLAIATLNKNTPEDEVTAVELLRGVLEDEPDHAAAHYCLGILLKRQVAFEEAEEHFRAVLEQHPESADALYELGDALFELDRTEEARATFERSLALEPLNKSAWYRLSSTLAELGETQGQMDALTQFRALEESGRGIERKTVYGKMGPLASVIRELDLPPLAGVAGAPPSFVDASAESGLADLRPGGPGDPNDPNDIGDSWDPASAPDPAVLSGGATSADLDGDGDFDLVLASFGTGPDAFLLLNDGGRFTDASDALGFASSAPRTVAVAAADFDGDSWPDIFLGRAGADAARARAQGGGETFERSFEGLDASEAATFDVAVADLDQDGDLDLALARATGLALYRWDGSGFADVTAESGVAAGAAVLSVVAADVDGDLDPDVVTGTPAPTAWINDRTWGFEPEPLAGAGGAPFTSVALGDADDDHLVDWVLSSIDGPPRLLLARGASDFAEDVAFGRAAAAVRATGATLFDADRDGDLDCLFVGERPALLSNDGADGWRDATEESGLGALDAAGARGHVPLDLEGDGDLDLAIVRNGAAPLLIENATEPGGDWIGIRAKGVTDAGKRSRGLSLGVGSHVELRTPGRTQTGWSGLGGGFASSAPQVLYFRTDGAERADLRIHWADGVVQSELDLAAGRVHVIEQTDREPSSCPIVFFWNGTTHEYLTDCLGVGGIGFLVEPGVFGPPDPEEVVRIGETLAQREGLFEVLLAEPMEEVVYLDRASLIRVEHPAGTLVFPDERFATDDEPATGRPLLVREDGRVFPKRATSAALPVADARLYTAPDPGPRDDTAALRTVDRSFAGPLSVHRRLLGYAAPWATELVFDAAELPEVEGGEGPVFLFVHGWVEYPFSRLNYAAWQGDLRMESWSLAVPDESGDGGWRVVRPELGYPAGKPRTMALEVTPYLAAMERGGELRLRLSSNLVVSLDQAFLARDLSAAALASGAMRVREVSPAEAELVFAGFPREYSPDGKKPLLYDHENRDRNTDFKALAGRYTEYGDALDLVEELDDRFAIYARGDELALRFDPAAFPRSSAPRTTWLLRVNGYCKDMCPQTASPETVEPLPFAAMEGYPPAEPLGLAHPSWLSPKNTRREPGRPNVR